MFLKRSRIQCETQKIISVVNMFQGLCGAREWNHRERQKHKQTLPVSKGSETLQPLPKKSICSLTLTLRNVVLVRVYTRPTQHARKFAPPFLRAKIKHRVCEKVYKSAKLQRIFSKFWLKRAWKWITRRKHQHESNVIVFECKGILVRQLFFSFFSVVKNQYRVGKREEKSPKW